MTAEEKRKAQKEYNKKWKANHPERVKEYNRKWREKNKEHIRAYKEQYRKEHLEQIRESNKKWRDLNKEPLNEYQKKWRKEHADSVREYQKRIRLKKKGYDTTIPFYVCLIVTDKTSEIYDSDGRTIKSTFENQIRKKHQGEIVKIYYCDTRERAIATNFGGLFKDN